MVATGFSEFIAPWKTIEILSQRKRRISSASSALMSTSSPFASWKTTDPLVITAGGLRRRWTP
ncbi:hypothetical protein D3C87_2178840 [compost metagenome]